MLDPHAPQAHRIADVWWLMFVLAVGVFLIVTAFVVWAIVRRRADTTSSADAERRDRRFVLLGGLVVPTVVLAVVAVATVRTTNALQPTGDGLQIHVSGVQWSWRVTYPDLGVTTTNEIHVPVGTPVDITLTSEDVDPQPLGSSAERQGRSHPRPDEPPLVHGERGRHLPGPMRRVLRPRARADGVRRDRRTA